MAKIWNPNVSNYPRELTLIFSCNHIGLAFVDCSASSETVGVLKQVVDLGCCIVLANKKPLTSTLVICILDCLIIWNIAFWGITFQYKFLLLNDCENEITNTSRLSFVVIILPSQIKVLYVFDIHQFTYNWYYGYKVEKWECEEIT